MNKKQFFLGVILAALIGGLVALAGASFFSRPQSATNFTEKQNTSFVNWLADEKFTVPDGLNFVAAAQQVTPAVVHVTSSITIQGSGGMDPLEEFFGFRNPRQQTPREGRGFGSGVIISEDGYIVTNNHVIDNASTVTIALEDNRRYTARVIGTDPTTDLALLKIEEKNLPFVKFGNSDDAQVGEWVLAVGNPFNLNSTVTAGIISAKARNIGILRDENNNLQVESFIQTDAVVNRGNSGGALVNLAGELIGINTAIASQTGSFSGYSFAVPTSIVKKVMDDLLEYGAVQRGLLGVQIIDVSPEIEEIVGEKIKATRGVYVAEVNEGSGGQDAGLKKGDVIIGIDGQTTYNTSRLQEMVARKRPGDKVEVKYLRDGKEMTTTATLKNPSGDTKVVVKEVPKTSEYNGVTFEDVTANIKERLQLEGGASIISVDNEAWIEAGVKEGFIVTRVGRTRINSASDLVDTLKKYEGQEVSILGVYPNGQRSYFDLDL
jgi:serine protease Do